MTSEFGSSKSSGSASSSDDPIEYLLCDDLTEFRAVVTITGMNSTGGTESWCSDADGTYVSDWNPFPGALFAAWEFGEFLVEVYSDDHLCSQYKQYVRVAVFDKPLGASAYRYVVGVCSADCDGSPPGECYDGDPCFPLPIEMPGPALNVWRIPNPSITGPLPMICDAASTNTVPGDICNCTSAVAVVRFEYR